MRLIQAETAVTCRVTEVAAAWNDQLARISDGAAAWAGLPTDAPSVMGVVNVTPDSFSDGGDHLATEAAISAGRRMHADGADIVDIGGESTNPESEPTPQKEEARRALPVIAALAPVIRVSIDTRHAATMAAALQAGAAIVNDISALADPDAAPLLAAHTCPIVLMHMRGTPQSMGRHARYRDVAVEVTRELAERIASAEAAGIARHRIAVDPGIGFAKTGPHNIELLQRLPLLLNLGCRIVVGASRKRFLGPFAAGAAAKQRGPGSLAAALYAAGRGAGVLRVHDVADAVQALRVWQGLSRPGALG